MQRLRSPSRHPRMWIVTPLSSTNGSGALLRRRILVRTEQSGETIEGESTGTITLSGDNRNRYVRCKVTQTVDGTAKTKAGNPACVRTEPLPPHDLSANAADEGGIRLSWQCNDERARNDAQKNVIGYEVNYRKIGTSEWAEEISSSKYDCKLDGPNVGVGCNVRVARAYDIERRCGRVD